MKKLFANNIVYIRLQPEDQEIILEYFEGCTSREEAKLILEDAFGIEEQEDLGYYAGCRMKNEDEILDTLEEVYKDEWKANKEGGAALLAAIKQREEREEREELARLKEKYEA